MPIFFLCHAWRMLCQSSLPWFDHSNNICLEASITQFPRLRFPISSSGFLPLMPKYSSRHPVSSLNNFNLRSSHKMKDQLSCLCEIVNHYSLFLFKSHPCWLTLVPFIGTSNSQFEIIQLSVNIEDTTGKICLALPWWF